MEQYICVHGHYYQPPRENPWFEEIERQESARPYHDWNERISAECYAPNAASRIMDGQGSILQIVSNYERTSFNFGPTLLSWMERHDTETHAAIVRADRESARRFGGHGSAMAQCYNHIIMPLAHPTDKMIQIKWGIRDFERRFQRKPEGMWLPETAVDLESLDLMAAEGVKFTVLAPRQAKRWRPMEGGDWQDASGETIDPTRAYLQKLPSGRTIALFFYDGPISRAVAFERLLTNGEKLTDRLMTAFNTKRTHPQLVNIATDGETYGHHHKYGDMALAWALHSIETKGRARLINYGEYLEKFPPRCEVDIVENTSWSCVHGIGRWRENCGCHNGGGDGWNQEWRGPLREAFDWLASKARGMAEPALDLLVKNSLEARADYISVILDRSPASRDAFIERHAKRALNERDRVRLFKILEMLRHAMLMYTSCGWFFDELSGIETVQCMQYAGRVVQLANKVFDAHLEGEFLDRLGRAKSNVAEHRDGERIYEKQVRPSIVGFRKVVARHAIGVLLEDVATCEPVEVLPVGARQGSLYSYEVEAIDTQRFEAGKTRLLCGRAHIRSRVTLDSDQYMYAVLHLGDHNFLVRVRHVDEEPLYGSMVRSVSKRFQKADLPETIQALDEHFGRDTFSLRSLFSDDRAWILQRILGDSLCSIEETFSKIYENHWPLMRYLVDIQNPLPSSLKAVAQLVQNTEILAALREEPMDIARLGGLVEQARAWKVDLDREALALEFVRRLEVLMGRIENDPSDLALMSQFESASAVMHSMNLPVNIWRLQNAYFRLLCHTQPRMLQRSSSGEAQADEWVKSFMTFGRYLSVKVDEARCSILGGGT
jgi:alpha-amylase/alpha-mannosidase (GH57 family)